MDERRLQRIAARWAGRMFGSAVLAAAPAAPPPTPPTAEAADPVAGMIAPADLWDYLAATMRRQFTVKDDGPDAPWRVYCNHCSFAIFVPKPASGFVVTEWDFLRLLQHQYETHWRRGEDGTRRKF